ncbi:NAD(P)/FAD-dependent oxidoreductase [Steroidobacter sp. S1-65]|uniref:Ferredoxin--NADP reductase n=1 Tax=Steroidobacter gossypii TaxID=2805490 RepID=A0ABS1WQW6_9GAMM|nr:NAD(P)/FAD-dependent oxidoreductase [Steroidobacter gossypii]MBM0103369.1 NAD(P)/FAD-dependent oxidoreductase [Steroidobacter gossypii]
MSTNVSDNATGADVDGAIQADAVIVGAGPCGLFQIFELGLLGIRAHIIDSLQHPGGQCSELYPEKPIYDIPALPVCGAQELVDRLLQQAKPFNAQFHLGQEVTELKVLPDHTFLLKTSLDTRFHAKTVIIAGGLGSFQPRRLGCEGVEAFEGQSIHYKVKNSSEFTGKHLLIFGGGDSALDWTLELAGKARSLTLVHRRAEFRAAPASVAKMRDLVASGSMRYVEAIAQSLITENGEFKGVRVKRNDGELEDLHGERALVFFGLHPKLGPIAEWGLALDKRAIQVDTEKFQTSVPGIFAVGDINTYPGKKKLILSGFHEAALAAFAVAAHLNPAKRIPLQYTTTSPIMQKRLGVTGEQTS